jgi:glycosyltransferase involved in cell wall biosynthesis
VPDKNNDMISIITPTYNHEKFIGTCIESVLAQTYSHWEMIIINDGSTDKTGNVVASYKDKRIKYVIQENKGIERLSETYNTALNIARGDYIAILEGDDFWPPYKLEVQVGDFKKREIVLSFGYAQIVASDGKPLEKIPLIGLPTEAKTNNPIGRSSLYMMNPFILTFTFPVSVVIRRETLIKIGGFQQPPNLPIVDYPTFLRLSLEGNFVFHNEILGFWRRHGYSVTKDRFPSILDGVHRYVSSFLTENGSRLPISKRESEKIKLGWQRFEIYRWFLLGRWYLVNEEWQRAREAFKKGLAVSRGSIFNAALRMGLLFSYIHVNMEYLMPLFGLATVYKHLKGGMMVSEEMLSV